MIVDSGVRDAPTRFPIETERPHARDPGRHGRLSIGELHNGLRVWLPIFWFLSSLRGNKCWPNKEGKHQNLYSRSASDSVYFADPDPLSLEFTQMPSSREGVYNYA